MPTRQQILSSQLKAAAEIWGQIRGTSEPADQWLHRFFRDHHQFGSRDRRFLSEVIFTLFRHKTFLEMWEREIAPSPSPLPLDGGEGMANLLPALAAAKEGLISEEESKSHKVATFYSRIREGKLPEGFQAADRSEALAALHSFPLWLVRKWEAAFGRERTEALLSSSNERPQLAIRTNPLKISREDLMKRLGEKGYSLRASEISGNGIVFDKRPELRQTQEFQSGLFEFQDEGSQRICEIVAPRPGETVWDVCAGAGGKSLYLAAFMKDKGRVVATDIRGRALEELWKRARRAGIRSIEVIGHREAPFARPNGDCKKRCHSEPRPPEDGSAIFVAERGEESQAQGDGRRAPQDDSEGLRMMTGVGFDKILIDAPCSGTGRLRRDPDRKWRLRPEEFLRHQSRQIEIVQKALPHLRPGGALFYVTCSLEREENEEVVEAVVKKHPSLERAGQDQLLWPPETGTDGFYWAALTKVRS